MAFLGRPVKMPRGIALASFSAKGDLNGTRGKWNGRFNLWSTTHSKPLATEVAKWRQTFHSRKKVLYVLLLVLKGSPITTGNIFFFVFPGGEHANGKHSLGPWQTANGKLVFRMRVGSMLASLGCKIRPYALKAYEFHCQRGSFGLGGS